MAYRVEVSRRAERDIEEAFEYIYSRAPRNAIRWRGALQRRLQALETNPERFGLAPEDEAAKANVRQLLYGRYRILYTVREKTVFVIPVRHGARLFLTGDDIDAID
jgi:plasmid stabilization system protein ParE